MQFSRLLKIAALTLCAATISFSAQAQLKKLPDACKSS